MDIVKEIKNSPFINPKKKYYFGVIKYHCPYFLPMNFNSSILSFRKLNLLSEDERNKKIAERPYFRGDFKFKNLPMVRRNKDWIFKVFGNHYWLSVGYPFKIHHNDLGWKDKYGSSRVEWCPAFYIFFFKWQFCIHWISPDGDNDAYYEQILWWRYYSNKDIVVAENTWGWKRDGISTWNTKYLR